MELEEIQRFGAEMREHIKRVVVGQDEAVTLCLVALLADGHLLFEGVPGTAKTLLARAFTAMLSLEFKRVQFTPDLMPGDLIGSNLFNFQTNEFTLTRGPLFTEVLLADEINRTPPKTQAALLEAMQERRITIDGVTHQLSQGFMVIATQNPIEQEGTYPLPEAQLDRFLFKVNLDYPARDLERELVRMHGHRAGMPRLEDFELPQLVDLSGIVAMRELVREVELSDPMIDYIVDIVRATRGNAALMSGASPRACNMLATSSRALAAVKGRSYVIPDDVKTLVPAAIGHRLILSPGAEIEGMTTQIVLRQILEQVPAPR